MGRRLGRVEERIAGPDVKNVGKATMWVLEQVRGLRVDLERVVVIEQIDIEQLHMRIVTTTNDYAFPSEVRCTVQTEVRCAVPTVAGGGARGRTSPFIRPFTRRPWTPAHRSRACTCGTGSAPRT